LLLFCGVGAAVAPASPASSASQEATRILQSQNTNDEEVQAGAVERLEALGPDAVQPLVFALKGENPYARALAALTLGLLQETTAMSALVATLDDADAEVRYRGTEALAAMGDRRARTAFRVLERWGMKSGSYDSLIGLGKQGNVHAVGQLAAVARRVGFFESQKAAFALSFIGRPPATESLGALLSIGDSAQRFIVISALGISRDTTARRFLRRALGDAAERNRNSALADLVEMDTASAPEVLRPLLNSNHADLRAKAANLLLPRHIRTLTPDVLLVYNHSDSAVRVASIDVAARVRRMTRDSSERASALDMVVRAMHDQSALVRRSAAKALWFVSDAAADSVRILALADRDDKVRWWAAAGVNLTTRVRIVEPLLSLLTDSYREVRFEAIKALAFPGDTLATSPLLALLPGADERTRAAVAWSFTRIKDTSAVADLACLLGDSSPRVRWWAAAALGDIGDTRATQNLVDALEDSNSTVALTAAGALGLVGDTAAIPALVRKVKEGCLAIADTTSAARLAWRKNALSARSARALAKLGGSGEKALLLLLRDSAPAVSRQAAIVLGSMQDSIATHALDDALRRKDLVVVAAAHQYYLKQTRTADEATIAAALVKFGDSGMADACGSSVSRALKAAAAKWRGQKHPPRPFPPIGHDKASWNPWDEEEPPSHRY
jgi:HEAT repeat protein